MKKITSTIIFLMLMFGHSSADIGVNVGISGQMGLFAATAKEDDTDSLNRVESHSNSEIAGVGYVSVFLEKTLGDRLAVGVDYVPDALSSDQVETGKNDKTSSATSARVENKLKVDFKDLTTFYVSANVTDNFYVKAGITNVDVITKENLGTGGQYGNTDLDGTALGFGYNRTMDNGMFVRAETTYMDFDGATVTSTNTNNVVTLKSLDGITAKLSIGKSF
mgnify:CR=1 FL=1